MSKYAKIIYVALFLLLLAEPHIVQGHITGIKAPFVQSFAIFVIVGIAALVYWLHQRDIETREKEKDILEEKNTTALHHLTDISSELGLANRRLPLLHAITTDLLKKTYDNNKNKQAIVEELLATTVVSLSQAEWGVFRFIDVERGRTVGEFKFARSTKNLPQSVIGNKILVDWQRQSDNFSVQIPNHIFVTTDVAAPTKCYYIAPKGNKSAENNQHVIQNVVDQAQLLYRYLYQ